MSRIYEALKSAQEMRSKSGLSMGDSLGVMEMQERRSSPRHELDIDLTVYGRSVMDMPFYAYAKALRGNSSGGLFLLVAPVHEGQNLLLINNQTSDEQICRVLSIRTIDEQTSEVAVLFPFPNPQFWQIPVTAAEI